MQMIPMLARHQHYVPKLYPCHEWVAIIWVFLDLLLLRNIFDVGTLMLSDRRLVYEGLNSKTTMTFMSSCFRS